MSENPQTHQLASLIQKILSKFWNAGLLEEVDLLGKQLIKKLSVGLTGKPLNELTLLRLRLMENPKNQRICFKTPDGVLIDGMLFNSGKKRVILFIPGVGSFYEKIGDAKSVPFRFFSFFKKHFPDYSIFSFNSRGIGESGGNLDLNLLPKDTLAAYTYLKEVLGYDFDSILLYTHSLGGLHATQGAGLVQKKFPQSSLSAINDRSFGELGTFTQAFFNDSSFGKMASRLVHKLRMNLSAKTAWETLKGQKVVIVSKYDQTIPYEKGAFCHNIESGTVIHLEESKKDLNHHTRSFSKSEAELIVSSILGSQDA